MPDPQPCAHSVSGVLPHTDRANRSRPVPLLATAPEHLLASHTRFHVLVLPNSWVLRLATPWSSQRCTAGRAPPPSFPTQGGALRPLGESRPRACSWTGVRTQMKRVAAFVDRSGQPWHHPRLLVPSRYELPLPCSSTAGSKTRFYLRHTPGLRAFNHRVDPLQLEHPAPAHHAGPPRPSPVSHACHRDGHVAGHLLSLTRFPWSRRLRTDAVHAISAGRTQKLRPTHQQVTFLRGSAPSPSRFTAKPSRASHG